MATIYCFSTTGNSLYASKIIAQKIGAEIRSMLSINEKCNDDVIGFVFPCYYLGLPKTVENFISNIDITNKNAYVFTVVTFGSNIYGIMGRVKMLLKKKGVAVSYGKKIYCVENYNVAEPYYSIQLKNNTPEFQKVSERNIELCAEEISDHTTNSFGAYTLLNIVPYSVFPANKPEVCSRKLTVSDDCTGCGICEKICPQGNISLIDGKITFNGHCEHCLGCIHNCPKKAINWNGKSEGKERYINPNIKVSDLIELNKKDKPVIVENTQH